MRILAVVLATGIGVFAYFDKLIGIAIVVFAILAFAYFLRKIHRHSRVAVILEELLMTPIAPLSLPDHLLSTVESSTRKDGFNEYELAAIAARLIDKRPEMYGLEPSDDRRRHLDQRIADYTFGEKIGFRATRELREI